MGSACADVGPGCPNQPRALSRQPLFSSSLSSTESPVHHHPHPAFRPQGKKEIRTSQSKSSLPGLRGSRRREPELGLPAAAAATTAVIFAFPGPSSPGALPLLLAAPPSPLPLRGAAAAAAAEVAVAVALLAAAPPSPSLLLRGAAATAAVEVAAMMTLPGTPLLAPSPRAPHVAPFTPRL